MFIILHEYAVDGGFGDSVYREEVVGCVETEDEANAYIEKWSKPEVYDVPYDELIHKKLKYRKAAVLDIAIDPFGEGNGRYGCYNYYDFLKEDK